MVGKAINMPESSKVAKFIRWYEDNGAGRIHCVRYDFVYERSLKVKSTDELSRI